jgi:hypothetical protein
MNRSPAVVLSRTVAPTTASDLILAASLNVDAVDAGKTAIRCRFFVDGDAIGVSIYTVVARILGPAEAVISLNAATRVPAGGHTVQVRCDQTDGSGSARLKDRSMTIQALGN